MVSPRGQRLLLDRHRAVGYLLCTKLLLEHGILGEGGEGAGDVFAYYTAGMHLRLGAQLYQAGVGGYAAFLYPPPLAQLFAPLSLLPFPVVVWLWRALLLAALRISVGSWRTAGIVLLVWPPVIAEIDAGNVHLLLAAATAEGIRGRAIYLGPVALTKFATLAAMPMGWVSDRRGALTGLGIAAGLVLVSVALAPDLWFDYVDFARSAPTSHPGWYNIGDLVPGWLRFASAVGLAIAAIRWRRLAAPAVTLALPALWVHGLSTLVALLAEPPTRSGKLGHSR